MLRLYTEAALKEKQQALQTKKDKVAFVLFMLIARSA
jgi:hypothetical protein